MVHGLLVTIFGTMSFDFAVKALVAFYELCFLFFRVIGGLNSVDIHMVPSLRGSLLLVLIFDSKHFVESAAEAFMKSVLFLPFAVLLDCFLGPAIKGPRCGEGVIDIRIYDVVKEPFL
jgi:hypothetical protein